MEVILKQDIQGLGYKYDTVEVKPGYGRNYLIPHGLAMVASKPNKRMIEENLKQMAHKAEKAKNDALALSEQIGDLTLEIGAKVGESGKIFGAVTTFQISDAIKDKGFDIDRKRISFKVQPKEVGEYVAILDLHKEVKHDLTFMVVPE